MKAKVIETGEVVNVTPYPTWYKENGQGPDRRKWDEDDLEFEPVPKRVSVDKACETIKELLGGCIIWNLRFGDSYCVDELIEDFKKRIEE